VVGDGVRQVIAVTGASGHLGQWVVARLTAAGHDVLCLSRNPIAQPTIEGVHWSKPVRMLVCDLTDRESVAAARGELRSAQALVHLAGHIPADTASPSAQTADTTLRTNVLGTLLLLEAIQTSERLATVVVASSFEVYGRPIHLPITEEHPTRPLGFYGASKLAAEGYLSLMGADGRVACSALRLPAVYGPGDTLERAVGNFVRAAKLGRPLEIYGDGADRRELVYADDAAEAVVAALEKKARGAINLGSGTGYTISEIADAVCRAADGVIAVVHRDRVRPRLDYVLAIDKARRELGWRSRTSLENGIRAQLEWVQSSGSDPQ
jgi:nucleoside-diphosphate-sugar epimerase